MTDDLERLIAEMAREAAHHHHCSLAAVTRQIRDLVAEARAEYRAAGAPAPDAGCVACGTHRAELCSAHPRSLLVLLVSNLARRNRDRTAA